MFLGGCLIPFLSNTTQTTTGSKLVDFAKALDSDADVAALKGEVQAFARTFPMPGFDIKTMKYN